MNEKITITSGGDVSAAGKYPAVNVSHKSRSNSSSVDLEIETEKGRALGTVAVDYFDGQLRVFIYLAEDEEPTHKVCLKKFSSTTD